jgi:cytochrome c6
MKNSIRAKAGSRIAALALVSSCFVWSSGLAHAQADANADPAAKTFKANCMMCHGEDGAGSALGKRLQTPDLRSKQIQDMPSEALEKIVHDGKNNMPAFGTRLDDDQIKKVIAYVRTLRAKDADSSK